MISTNTRAEDRDLSDLPLEEWLLAIEDIGEFSGYYEPIGDEHSVIFTDESPKLLVTFESFDSIRRSAPRGLPLGYEIAKKEGWSHLGLIAHSKSWFRTHEVWGYFDRLVDEGFLEDFDNVVFYGAGAHGYAAAAYSVTAPGSTVIAIAPQATLNPRLAGWDTRFAGTQRMDFTTRYGFAPDMMDGCDRAFVLYDPAVTEDAMHAALFTRPHVTQLPVRYFGLNPEPVLAETPALEGLLTAAMTGQMTLRDAARALRHRREHTDYLRRALAAVERRDNPWLTALLARHVLENRGHGPRFRRAYRAAEVELRKRGIPVPAYPDKVDIRAL